VHVQCIAHYHPISPHFLNFKPIKKPTTSNLFFTKCKVFFTFSNICFTFAFKLKTCKMKSNYLFPSKFKFLGLVILIPVSILGLLMLIYGYEPELLNVRVLSIIRDEFNTPLSYFSIENNNIYNEIIGCLLIASALMVAFSKEKKEDEFIAKIRLESLVWATYFNYAILFISLIFVYDLAFLWVMVFNMFTLLIFFILRFNWQVWKMNKNTMDEE
jgi:hypothetical protein